MFCFNKINELEKRIKMLECNHDGEFEYYSLIFRGNAYWKVCEKCKKEFIFDDYKGWLSDKLKYEQRLCDATAQQLKECKP